MNETALKTIIDDLLEDQKELTAIDRFSNQYDRNALPSRDQYQELIPLSTPGAGEQYAFQVDLDACSGCKACVVACHSLNGLDENESWRDVGTLIGKDSNSNIQQTVTTACHHCEDPACLNGCPTRAYEKDSQTGIVKHLDDQCIGCRYCELKCPYEVPKYNDRLGIVRKCDMCHGRLSAGEAPACVQACPNQAIKIRIVSQPPKANRLVPGTVSSDYTQPMTEYVNVKTNTTPFDSNTTSPAKGHTPLVGMLVLTQAGVGALVGDWLTRILLPSVAVDGLIFGITFLFAGLIASILHLGQPLKAWKAFLGWRTSWLSREIISFGLLSALALAYAAAVWQKIPPSAVLITGAIMAIVGLISVWTSVKVYSDTQRKFWNQGLNLMRFSCTAITVGVLFSPWYGFALLPIVTVMLVDSFLTKGIVPELEHSAKLLSGELKPTMCLRQCFAFVAVSTILFPMVSLAAFLISELAGRSMFFRAVDQPKMPGM